MNEQILKQALSQARSLAAKAKDGELKIDGCMYTFTFDPREWVYEVKDEAGETVTRFNTKRLSQAKQWFREYMGVQ